jgi:hypothetical protein
MVYTRFDSRFVNELVSPTRVEVFALGGSKSAVWYSLLKHSVVASGVRPREVVIFFRGREIVQLFKSGGDVALARTTNGHDPVLERMLGTGTDEARGLRERLAELAPVERLRASSWEHVDALALRVSSALAHGPVGETRKRRINRIFGVEALRAEPGKADEQADGVEDAEEPLDDSTDGAAVKRKGAYSSIESSLLPEMLALARQNGISLTFAHVRTRRHAEGGPDSPARARFIQSLRTYVERNGATYLDLTQNEWETLDSYGRGDHTAPRRKRWFTRRFVKEYPEPFRSTR